MPMYDYVCNKCNHEEKDMLVNTSTPIPCPKCGDIMKREFPRTGHFKLVGEDWSKDGTCLNKDEDVVRE